jgi:hypothetical protein
MVMFGKNTNITPGLLAACAGILLLFTACETTQPPVVSSPDTLTSVPVGNIPIALPDNPADRIELGVSHLNDAEYFQINQMDCKVLVVEVFDFYCHVCQSSAENLNILHSNLSVPPFDSKVCMMGIGKENTAFETDTFRRNLHVAFPMLPDPSALFAQAIPVTRTPHVMILRKDGHDYQIIQQKIGYFSREDVEHFTELIISITTQ